jgi:hypothetical protein
VPADERDHGDADGDVEHGVEPRDGSAREERQEPELHGVGGDGEDPGGEDAAWRRGRAPLYSAGMPGIGLNSTLSQLSVRDSIGLSPRPDMLYEVIRVPVISTRR